MITTRDPRQQKTTLLWSMTCVTLIIIWDSTSMTLWSQFAAPFCPFVWRTYDHKDLPPHTKFQPWRVGQTTYSGKLKANQSWWNTDSFAHRSAKLTDYFIWQWSQRQIVCYDVKLITVSVHLQASKFETRCCVHSFDGRNSFLKPTT